MTAIDSRHDFEAIRRLATELRRRAIDHAITATVGRVKLWAGRLVGRAELSRLSARDLKDIGVTEYEVRMECAKPFWKD
ncbi:DUF1127 domain-containing protein [Magnetospirillum moscoviense]|uniref:YjiS-like domain-containing protein n=1 Tax=Magnetospirillum moscoviense TaxID=1437059 RepID=A0A178M749_9PROT|nr:DUF1127 domain-containing protein [Magnetospirillum moscoviense]MBF0326717.1 DUF1127 domain-containing protein [Alphaproteobacteria bacterium]OAN44346.1 hypothetical protein A6A05_17535 [Magnetospirillum moscoviense]